MDKTASEASLPLLKSFILFQRTAEYQQVLAKGEPYQDLGPDYFHKQGKEQQARGFVRQLEALGEHVELASLEEATASFVLFTLKLTHFVAQLWW